MQALNGREGIYAFRKAGLRRTVEDAGPYIVSEGVWRKSHKPIHIHHIHIVYGVHGVHLMNHSIVEAVVVGYGLAHKAVELSFVFLTDKVVHRFGSLHKAVIAVGIVVCKAVVICALGRALLSFGLF